jgi:hypothetical protein
MKTLPTGPIAQTAAPNAIAEADRAGCHADQLNCLFYRDRVGIY